MFLCWCYCDGCGVFVVVVWCFCFWGGVVVVAFS